MRLEDNIKILLGRHFSGESTPEDKKNIEHWLMQNDENQKLYMELEEIWIMSDPDIKNQEYNLEQALCQFNARTELYESREKYSFRQILKYAAIFFLLIGTPLLYFLIVQPGSSSDNLTTVFCDYGDRTSITLPDSSVVWLNAGSQLTFNNNFSKGSRELVLIGEAYFKVKKDPANPFTVNTSDLTVEVLGTEFNFKAYPDEAETAVTLTSGSLQVIHGNKNSLLIPNQKLNFHKHNQETTIENLINMEPETGWVNGRLIFQNESLAELERKLERWFDVEIEFADEEVKTRRFSGTLERESILEVISYFGSSHYVDYNLNGNVITFYSQKQDS